MPRLVRSYRSVHQVDWRLHKIPNGGRKPWTIPRGVPLAALGWFVLALAAMVVLSQAPITGWLVGVTPWGLRYIALPVVAAVVLHSQRPAGLPAHRFAMGWVASRLAASRQAGGVAVPRNGSTRIVRAPDHHAN